MEVSRTRECGCPDQRCVNALVIGLDSLRWNWNSIMKSGFGIYICEHVVEKKIKEDLPETHIIWYEPGRPYGDYALIWARSDSERGRTVASRLRAIGAISFISAGELTSWHIANAWQRLDRIGDPEIDTANAAAKELRV